MFESEKSCRNGTAPGRKKADWQYGEIEIMRNCYRNSLQIAKDLNCKSLSIPLLATGNYGCPKETALNIALDEISKDLFENEMDLPCFND